MKARPKWSARFYLFSLVIFSLTAHHSFLGAATLQVDTATGSDSGDCLTTPCKTIGYALTRAVEKDIIAVAAGTYFEKNIYMIEGVSIQGAGWDNTIIDGGASSPDPVVHFGPGLTAATVLSGVKIQYGGNSITAGGGGGIRVEYSSPIIENTWIENCMARYGGGVYVLNGSPVFNNVPVWSCQAEYGGGFNLTGDGQVTITGNPFDPVYPFNGTFLLNSATQDGGGIFVSGTGLTLIGTRLYWNAASYGGGLSVQNTSQKIKIQFNDISGNSASRGGGLTTFNADNLEIIANLFGNPVSWLGSLLGGNIAAQDGGGAFFAQSNGMVQTNFFLNNKTTSGSGGGAVITANALGPTISGNAFDGNSALSNGGGLFIYSGASPLIDANMITRNTTCLGGGVYLYQTGAVNLTNNIIAQNVATCPGLIGGIQTWESPARIINNTIADNTGSGITFAKSENILIVNNIISGNSTYGLDRYSLDNTTQFTTHHNDFYSNASGPYNNLPPGAGDLALDPLYQGGTTDLRAFYHLQNGSPVAATGSAGGAPPKDIDGDIRIWKSVSMGADEPPGNSRLHLPLILRN